MEDKYKYGFSSHFQSTHVWGRQNSYSSHHEAMFHLEYKFCEQPSLEKMF